MMRVMLYVPYYAACIALASMLWRDPGLLFVAFVGLSIAMLWRWHTFHDVIFFIVPCILGPIGEAIAIYNGAWHYSKPFQLVPIWLPLAWGCAALYMKKTADALADYRVERKWNRRHHTINSSPKTQDLYTTTFQVVGATSSEQDA
jgi:hypothetical protein